jgi:hypothetical protein
MVPGSSADVVLARWRPDDLERLRRSTVDLLESLKGGDSPTSDQADYSRVITALQDHLGYASIAQMLEAWTEPAFPSCGR